MRVEGQVLKAEAYVVSLGAHSPLLTRKVGVSARALADIVSGRQPEIDFAFSSGRSRLRPAARSRQVIRGEIRT